MANLRRRLNETPGVVAASYSDQIPLALGSHPWHDLIVEGYTPAKAAEMQVERTIISPGYFATMGVPLIEGRTFDVRDRAETPVVVVINRTAAARLFGSTSAIGRTVLAPAAGVRATVIGVVGDVRHERLAEDPRPAIYVRNAQNPGIFMTLVARADEGAK